MKSSFYRAHVGIITHFTASKVKYSTLTIFTVQWQGQTTWRVNSRWNRWGKREDEMKKQWSEWMPRGIWYRLLFNQRRPLQSPWHTHHLLGLNTAELMLKTYCSCLWRIKHWDTWKYFPGGKKNNKPWHNPPHKDLQPGHVVRLQQRVQAEQLQIDSSKTINLCHIS